MSTIRIKSSELVRKFADIKSLVQQTGAKVIVEEYKKPVLAILPVDEEGEVIFDKSETGKTKKESLKQKFAARKINIKRVNFD